MRVYLFMECRASIQMGAEVFPVTPRHDQCPRIRPGTRGLIGSGETCSCSCHLPKPQERS